MINSADTLKLGGRGLPSYVTPNHGNKTFIKEMRGVTDSMHNALV